MNPTLLFIVALLGLSACQNSQPVPAGKRPDPTGKADVKETFQLKFPTPSPLEMGGRLRQGFPMYLAPGDEDKQIKTTAAGGLSVAYANTQLAAPLNADALGGPGVVEFTFPKPDCKVASVTVDPTSDLRSVWGLQVAFEGKGRECGKLNQQLFEKGFHVRFPKVLLQVFPTEGRSFALPPLTWTAPPKLSVTGHVSWGPAQLGPDYSFGIENLRGPVPSPTVRFDEAKTLTIDAKLDKCGPTKLNVLPMMGDDSAVGILETGPRAADAAACENQVRQMLKGKITATAKQLKALRAHADPTKAAAVDLAEAQLILSPLPLRNDSAALPTHKEDLGADFTISNGKAGLKLEVSHCGHKGGEFRASFKGKDGYAMEVVLPALTPVKPGEVLHSSGDHRKVKIIPSLTLNTGELMKAKAGEPDSKTPLFYMNHPLGYVIDRMHCGSLYYLDEAGAVRGRIDCLNVMRFDPHGEPALVDVKATFRCKP